MCRRKRPLLPPVLLRKPDFPVSVRLRYEHSTWYSFPIPSRVVWGISHSFRINHITGIAANHTVEFFPVYVGFALIAGIRIIHRDKNDVQGVHKHIPFFKGFCYYGIHKAILFLAVGRQGDVCGMALHIRIGIAHPANFRSNFIIRIRHGKMDDAVHILPELRIAAPDSRSGHTGT